MEHHEHLEEHAHLDFADDSTQTDDAAFSNSPAKPDAHAHHREEHAHQIVKSSKGGPLGHYMKKTKSFSGKIEAGAGEEEHKDGDHEDDHHEDDHDHEDGTTPVNGEPPGDEDGHDHETTMTTSACITTAARRHSRGEHGSHGGKGARARGAHKHKGQGDMKG